MSGGILYFLSSYFIRFVRTLLLLSVWKVVFTQTGDAVSDQLDQVLRYTLLASIFWQQVDVQTTASTTFWEGTLSSRFLRPLGIFNQYMAETIGKWMPGLIFYSLPMLLLSPFLGINMRPPDLSTLVLFILSLFIGIFSGFAMDFIFTGLGMGLGHGYIVIQIRAASTLLLSGALIPLNLLPFGIGRALEWLPFATMASAPLSIYTGISRNVLQIVALQLVWCVVLWLFAFYTWKKNRQRLVIFGG